MPQTILEAIEAGQAEFQAVEKKRQEEEAIKAELERKKATEIAQRRLAELEGWFVFELPERIRAAAVRGEHELHIVSSDEGDPTPDLATFCAERGLHIRADRKEDVSWDTGHVVGHYYKWMVTW